MITDPMARFVAAPVPLEATSGNALYIGYSGTGVLNVTGGSISTVGGGYLGYNAGSSGPANVSSGTWTNSGTLSVGNSGTGVINITGGSVSSGTGYVGYGSGSSGTATVSSGSWVNSGNFYVGYTGSGY